MNAPATTRELIAQSESESPVHGIYYGYSVYRTITGFEGVMHTRAYDGIKVSAKWNSEPVAVAATTPDEAVAEMRDRMIAMMRAIAGEDDA